MSPASPLFLLSLIFRLLPAQEFSEPFPCKDSKISLHQFQGDFLQGVEIWKTIKQDDQQNIRKFVASLHPGRYRIDSSNCDPIELLVTRLGILLHSRSTAWNEVFLQVVQRDTLAPAPATQFSVFAQGQKILWGLTGPSGLLPLDNIAQFLPVEIRVQNGNDLDIIVLQKKEAPDKIVPTLTNVFYAYSESGLQVLFLSAKPSPSLSPAIWRILDKKRRQVMVGDFHSPVLLSLPETDIVAEVSTGEFHWQCELLRPRLMFSLPPRSAGLREIYVRKLNSGSGGITLSWKAQERKGREWLALPEYGKNWLSVPVSDEMRDSFAHPTSSSWLEVEKVRKYVQWMWKEEVRFFTGDIMEIPLQNFYQFLFLPSEMIPIFPGSATTLTVSPSLFPGFWKENLLLDGAQLVQKLQFIRVEEKPFAELEEVPEDALGGQWLSLPAFSDDMVLLFTPPDLDPAALLIPEQPALASTFPTRTEVTGIGEGKGNPFCFRVEWIQRIPAGESAKAPLPASPGIYQLLLFPISAPGKLTRKIFQISEGIFLEGNYEQGEMNRLEVKVFPVTTRNQSLLVNADIPIRLEAKPGKEQKLLREWLRELAEVEQVEILARQGASRLPLGVWKPTRKSASFQQEEWGKIFPPGPYLFSLLSQVGQIKSQKEGWFLLTELMDWVEKKMGCIAEIPPDVICDALLLRALREMAFWGFSPDEGIQGMLRMRWFRTPEQPVLDEILRVGQNHPSLCPIFTSSCSRLSPDLFIKANISSEQAVVEFPPGLDGVQVEIFLPLPDNIRLMRADGMGEETVVLLPVREQPNFHLFHLSIEKEQKIQFWWEKQWKEAKIFLWIPGKGGGWLYA